MDLSNVSWSMHILSIEKDTISTLTAAAQFLLERLPLEGTGWHACEAGGPFVPPFFFWK